MSLCEPITSELIQKGSLSADGLFSEMIGGRILRSAAADKDGRRLCFLLGTLLSDHLRHCSCDDTIIFGPQIRRFGACNIFLTDLLTCSGEEPQLAVNLMPASGSLYSCLDKAFAYQDAGAAEYWVIDLPEQFIYCYDFTAGVSFRRLSFDQLLRSACYPDFSCCLSEVMLQDQEALQELAVFYRFKKEFCQEPSCMLSDQCGLYQNEEWESYTPEQFYRWLRVREQLPDRARFAELLAGNIFLQPPAAFRHQFIQGSLYFAIRSFLEQTGSSCQLCFTPLAVEMSDGGVLDSVVHPDLFLLPSSLATSEEVFRGVPLWIAEIAEPGTAVQTYIDKAEIYAYHGLQEFWIINDWKRQVMVFGADREPELHSYEEEIPLSALPGLTITPQDIF